MAGLVEIKDMSPNPELVGQLEYFLDLAKKGKIRTMITVCGWYDDVVSHGWAVDPRNSEKRLVAELSLLHTDFSLKVLRGNDSYLDTIIDESY